MSLFVKICGITDSAAAESAVEAGADAVGFVFATSPRQVTTGVAASISAGLPPEILRVAVFRRPSRGELEQVLEDFTPDLVQADSESLKGFGEIATLPVFREGVGATPDGGRFLYEGPASGSGRVVDLSTAAEVARAGDMVLAGGLGPDNVGSAISRVRPYGVDVSSGVESSPGTKDPELIRSFVYTAREAGERLVRS